MGSWKRLEPRPAWYVIFEDQPGAVVKMHRDGDHFAHFDITLLLGHIERRRVKAMWLISEDGENGDVVRVHGRVPTAIADRFAAGRVARASNDRPAKRNPTGGRVDRRASRVGRSLLDS